MNQAGLKNIENGPVFSSAHFNWLFYQYLYKSKFLFIFYFEFELLGVRPMKSRKRLTRVMDICDTFCHACRPCLCCH